jgi:hypothetical protein
MNGRLHLTDVDQNSSAYLVKDEENILEWTTFISKYCMNGGTVGIRYGGEYKDTLNSMYTEIDDFFQKIVVIILKLHKFNIITYIIFLILHVRVIEQINIRTISNCFYFHIFLMISLED